MKKNLCLFLLIGSVTLFAACDSGEIPLPHGTQEDKSLCPAVALKAEDTCFSVPLSHYETITWFQDVLQKEGWSVDWGTDDEPIKAYIQKKNKKTEWIFYKQMGDEITGLMKKHSN